MGGATAGLWLLGRRSDITMQQKVGGARAWMEMWAEPQLDRHSDITRWEGPEKKVGGAKSINRRWEGAGITLQLAVEVNRRVF